MGLFPFSLGQALGILIPSSQQCGKDAGLILLGLCCPLGLQGWRVVASS